MPLPNEFSSGWNFATAFSIHSNKAREKGIADYYNDIIIKNCSANFTIKSLSDSKTYIPIDFNVVKVF